MEAAKIFTNGGSQAVRLPKDCRFEGNEVLVNKIGNVVMLMPKNDEWASFITALGMFTDDYMREPPEELPLQERDSL